MFVYCGNNPVINIDITGTRHVKGIDACGGAGNYNSVTVGFATYYSQTKDYWSIYNLYGGIDKGESYTISSNGNEDYDLIFFNQISHEDGTVFDNMRGMNVNIKNGGLRIAKGPSSYSITVCLDNTSYEYFSSPTKTSFTIASGVDYKNLTAEGYISYYLRPAPILCTVAIACYVPEIAYFVASYFLSNGANYAYA